MQHDSHFESFLCGADKQITVSQLLHLPVELELGGRVLLKGGFILQAVETELVRVGSLLLLLAVFQKCSLQTGPIRMFFL